MSLKTVKQKQAKITCKRCGEFRKRSRIYPNLCYICGSYIKKKQPRKIIVCSKCGKKRKQSIHRKTICDFCYRVDSCRRRRRTTIYQKESRWDFLEGLSLDEFIFYLSTKGSLI